MMICSILVWHISVAGGGLTATRHMLVPSPRCCVNVVEFDASGGLVALAYHNQVEVVTVQSKAVYITLEGHLAKFDPQQPHVLVTGSEDRTFKVWDLAEQCLRYQSAVLSAHSILAVAIHPTTSDICIGFADGIVRIYHHFATELAALAIGAHIHKLEQHHHVVALVDATLAATQNVVSSLPPWARSQNATASAMARHLLAASSSGNLLPPELDAKSTPVVEVACTILSLHYVVLAAELELQSVLPASRQVLLVGTTNHVMCVDALSYQLTTIHSFQAHAPVVVGMAASVAMTTAAPSFPSPVEDDPGLINMWVSSAFQPCITRLQVTANSKAAAAFNMTEPDGSNDSSMSRNNQSECLSMVPQTSPPKTSILCLSPLLLQLQDVSKHSKVQGDHPVTFHSRIKSSGYGSSSQQRKPPSKFVKTSSRTKNIHIASKSSSFPSYPMDSHRLTRLDSSKTRLKWHQGCINHVTYTADGTSLASAGNDRLAQVTSAGTLKKPDLLVGHEHYVKTVRWSLSGRYLVTASPDKTARVWGVPCGVASLTLRSTSGSDICDAAFYYMDKFVVVAMGNKVNVFQYVVDDKHAQHINTSDIARLENHSRAKKVAAYHLDAVKAITSVTCANATLSHLLVVAASDKSIRIIDVSVGKTARVIQAAHATRAPHTVVIPQASAYVSHSPDVSNLVLSAACDNAMHLWDIRADNCVLRFGEHANRVHAVGCAFSPCLRYVAAGSEDKVTHLYDLRTGRTLDKLHGHTDVVTAVAFHPVKPWLCTAAADGSVRFYGPAND
ncbi:hypothetical protein DYB34_007775 [Aphanomyces astaci]|uniref:Uncharacterized protein n=1 Tax=Aphanomyces astaci TaxID=112090 RepID=A0A418C234_APHAT|nr:hypothetical protein DYB34_007775 [Aphanomyces astaci]